MARGCLPELVDPGLTGFLADDEAGVIDALRRLDELDPDACMAAARRSFAPESMAEAYEELYADTVSRCLEAPASSAR